MRDWLIAGMFIVTLLWGIWATAVSAEQMNTPFKKSLTILAGMFCFGLIYVLAVIGAIERFP